MFKAQRFLFSPEGDGMGGGGGGGAPAGGGDPGGAPGGGVPGGAPTGSGTGNTMDYSALSTNFRQALASEYQTHPSLTDIKDLNGLVKSYISAQSMVGADRVVIPKEGASAEEWKSFYQKTGTPDAPEAYGLEQIELPQGAPVDHRLDPQIQQLFHKYNLTKAQAAGLYKEYSDLVSQDLSAQISAQEQAVQTELANFKAQVGGQFDTMVAQAKQAVYAFGGEEVKAWFNETGIGDHPKMIQLFANIGKLIGEDKGFRDGSGAGGFATSQDGARAEIAQLQGDQDFMKSYMDRDHPNHLQAKTRMNNLWQKAYPGMAQG